jgi:hypothetical protein
MQAVIPQGGYSAFYMDLRGDKHTDDSGKQGG